MDYSGLKICIPAGTGSVRNYIKAMFELGAEPIVVSTPCAADEFDGLILPGGGDVNPSRYGEPDRECGPIDDKLDELQFSVLDNFVKFGKPVFGICRGHQLINVFFGGTIIQDIKSNVIHTHNADGDVIHAVHSVGESYLKDMYGEEFVVNSSHHQAVGRLAEDMKIDLRSLDGIVEGIEHISLPVFSVQWHPERMCFNHSRNDTVSGEPILRHFLDLCLINK